MKRALVIMGGFALMGGLSACEPGGPRYDYVDARTQAQRADACVAQFEPNGTAPQVMTYDSQSKTEVHMNQDGKLVTVTAQNKPDSTSLGMEGKVGGSRPVSCTDATVARGRTDIPKDYPKKSDGWWWKK
ncbi:hypothetical protein PQU94_09995 [Asticcacaulis sp. DXS10W]|uniref:Lipoprotein n=1 Tax=Asticcacaulis currens TaxID=2984210 RepID=A0ABT5IEK0_9CAUL|nr:hypothetical protein [Asticcacaulis currens]MDC7694611.1 hypothetical protein [Asticcacaulis currens]